MIGQTVLHYTILEKLGEGGMGVVYKAEDATLHRTVALKFLPEKATGSELDKSRFLQEARAAAVLNHPNICTIHAIEEHEGRTFIVMEHVEGTTLREKLPFRMLNQAFDAAIQIGEALAEAHSKGIVHRDVKSENIMITPKGQIKVMDFGLAKLKGSLKLTRTSSTVGTLGYMSPEQIQGGEVDHRSDIFSLGVVLFEMLTGQLPFRGEHEAAVLYSIVNEEPKQITDVLKDAPPGLAGIFAKAFEKDPNERYQSAADLAVDLKRLKRQSSPHPKSRSSMQAVPASQGRPGSSVGPGGGYAGGDSEAHAGARGDAGAAPVNTRLPLYAALLLLAIALGYIAYLRFSAPGEPAVRAMSYAKLTEQAGEETFPDISPDGGYIVYVRPSGPTSDIYLQRIGGGNPVNLTEGSAAVNTHPAYSPNGEMIAFRSGRDGGGIFVMGSTGESVRRLTNFGYSPSWSPDGSSIVFCTEYIEHPFSRGTESKLWTVDVKDGKTSMVYAGDGVQPRWSPDGNRILFWGLPKGTGKRELWTISAAGGEPVRLTDDDAIDWSPVWAPDGRGVYYLSNRGGTMNLWMLPVDPGSGRAAGAAEPRTLPTQNCTGLRVSRDGKKFIYLSTERRANIYRAPFDPKTLRIAGPSVPVTEGSREFEYLSVSPDGRMIAFTDVGAQEDIGVMGIDGKGFRKLTNDRFKDRGPQWSNDGKKIAFYSERSGTYQIWTVSPDGSGIEQRTFQEGEGITALPRWFPGDKALYFQADDGGGIVDLTLPAGPGNVRRLKEYPGDPFFSGGNLSPDGTRLVGSIDQGDGTGGGLAVYTFADSSYRNILDEGAGPIWLADGRTILFIGEGKLKLLDLATGNVTALEGLPRFTDFSQFTVTPDNRSLYFVRIETESDVWEAQAR